MGRFCRSFDPNGWISYSTLVDTISILIVEDVDEMRLLLEHVIQGIAGLEVRGLAKNGAEARNEFLRRRPSLVLLDEILPGEASYDLLAEWVSLGGKVLLMTGQEEPGQDLPPGALGRIAKPSWKSVEEDRKRIKKTVFRLLGRSEA